MVKQSAADIITIRTSLAYQDPSICNIRGCGISLEQTRERISFSPAILAHVVIKGVTRLITRCGTSEARHRFRLRTEKRLRTFWQSKATCLALYHRNQRIVFWVYTIAESDVTVADAKHHIHNMTPILFYTAHGF